MLRVDAISGGDDEVSDCLCANEWWFDSLCGLEFVPLLLGSDGTVCPPIGPLAAELEVINSAAISLIVDNEHVDDNDTDDDEASVAIISVVMAVVSTIK